MVKEKELSLADQAAELEEELLLRELKALEDFERQVTAQEIKKEKFFRHTHTFGYSNFSEHLSELVKCLKNIQTKINDGFSILINVAVVEKDIAEKQKLETLKLQIETAIPQVDAIAGYNGSLKNIFSAEKLDYEKIKSEIDHLKTILVRLIGHLKEMQTAIKNTKSSYQPKSAKVSYDMQKRIIDLFNPVKFTQKTFPKLAEKLSNARAFGISTPAEFGARKDDPHEILQYVDEDGNLFDLRGVYFVVKGTEDAAKRLFTCTIKNKIFGFDKEEGIWRGTFQSLKLFGFDITYAMTDPIQSDPKYGTRQPIVRCINRANTLILTGQFTWIVSDKLGRILAGGDCLALIDNKVYVRNHTGIEGYELSGS